MDDTPECSAIALDYEIIASFEYLPSPAVRFLDALSEFTKGHDVLLQSSIIGSDSELSWNSKYGEKSPEFVKLKEILIGRPFDASKPSPQPVAKPLFRVTRRPKSCSNKGKELRKKHVGLSAAPMAETRKPQELSENEKQCHIFNKRVSAMIRLSSWHPRNFATILEISALKVVYKLVFTFEPSSFGEEMVTSTNDNNAASTVVPGSFMQWDFKKDSASALLFLIEEMAASKVETERLVDKAFFRFSNVFNEINPQIQIQNMNQRSRVSQGSNQSTSADAKGTQSISLFDLSPELLSHIGSYLTSSDLRALRLACKFLYEEMALVVPGLRLTLFPHQRATLQWMMARESAVRCRTAHPYYQLLCERKQGHIQFKLAFDLVNDRLQMMKDLPLMDDCPGGFLCDEPGLGKTVTAISLILKTLHAVPRVRAEETLKYLQFQGRRIFFYEPRDVESFFGRGRVVLGSSRGDGGDGVTDAVTTIAGSPPGKKIRRTSRLSKAPDFFDKNKGDDVMLQQSLGNIENKRVFLSRATLIVVPRTLMRHWLEQLNHVQPGSLSVFVLTSQKVPSSFQVDCDEVLPNVTTIADSYDIVLTSFEELGSHLQFMFRGTSDLVRVHWLRILIDEGHKLGFMNSHGAVLQSLITLKSGSRWILSGTPLPGFLGLDVSHLWPQLKFLGEPAFGESGRDAFTKLIQKPCISKSVLGRERLKRLMERLLVRHRKQDIASIPKCIKKVVHIELQGESKRCYDDLVRLVRRNLFLADCDDETHEESLLNPKNAKNLRTFLDNLRISCCLAGHIQIGVEPKDLNLFLDELIRLRTEELGQFRLPYTPYEWEAIMSSYMMVPTITVSPVTSPSHSNANEGSSSSPAAASIAVAGAVATASSNSAAFHTLPQHQSQLPAEHPPQLQVHGDGEVTVVSLHVSTASRFLAENRCFYDEMRGEFVCGKWRYRGILALIAQAIVNGTECQSCGRFTKAPLVTPCLDVICVICASKDTKRCIVCGDEYKLGSKGEPEELIELQPPFRNDPVHFVTSSQTLSTKFEYLLSRLEEIASRERHLYPSQALAPYDSSASLQVGSLPKEAMTPAPPSPSKILIFSQFKIHLDSLKSLLQTRGIIYNTFDSEGLHRFRHDNRHNIMLIDKRASLGHDLSFVKYVFLLEPLWDTSLENQIISRAHRMGAKKVIHVEKLVVVNSIEEEMESVFRRLDDESDGGGVSMGLDALDERAMSSKDGLERAKLRSMVRNLHVMSEEVGVKLRSVSDAIREEKRKLMEQHVERKSHKVGVGVDGRGMGMGRRVQFVGEIPVISLLDDDDDDQEDEEEDEEDEYDDEDNDDADGSKAVASALELTSEPMSAPMPAPMPFQAIAVTRIPPDNPNDAKDGHGIESMLDSSIMNISVGGSTSVNARVVDADEELDGSDPHLVVFGSTPARKKPRWR